MKLRTMIAAALEPWVSVRDSVNGVLFADVPALGKWVALRAAEESVTLDWGRPNCTTEASVQVRRGHGTSFMTWATSAKIGNLYFLYRRHAPAAVLGYSVTWRDKVLKPLKRTSEEMPS